MVTDWGFNLVNVQHNKQYYRKNCFHSKGYMLGFQLYKVKQLNCVHKVTAE